MGRGQGVIIFLIIALMMLSMLYFSVKSLSTTLDEVGRSITFQSGTNDVANAVANNLFGAVVFLPHNVSLSYRMTVPSQIAGEPYDVKYENESVCVIGVNSFCVYMSGIKSELNSSLNYTGVGVLWINVSR